MEFITRLISAVIAAVIASAKGRNIIIWFILGFLFEWIAPVIVLIIPAAKKRRVFPGRGNRSDMRWRRGVSGTCPYCGSDVIIDDIPGKWTCPDCGRSFIYGEDGRFYRIREDGISRQIGLITTLFARAAKSDGVVTEDEIAQVDRIVRGAFRPNHQELRRIMKIFNESRYSSGRVEDVAEQLYRSVAGRRDILTDTLTALVAVAAADGRFTSEEETMIRSVAGVFGLDGVYEQIKAEFFDRAGLRESGPDLASCYRLLGCSADDSNEVIRKSYRHLIKKNHPDLLISRGASEETVRKANKKIEAVKEAYEQIMAARA
ncbi:TerB family tellurite resistance protein [Sporolactobacillus sp. Y61]|uniref:TerB family tellurite resistance protein n=1 Tax=Sporolactobacillus sp. Y61 TaxID=3160863 RepID=A0AAU8IH71_9BACL|nr:TerB family tellurite resistance protein [Sporolactobacillus sp. THM19-2]